MKTILIGFDAFDPKIFEKLQSEGKTPNLRKIMDSGGYSRFSVPNPPQSEVSWTSIATGLNPGGHGIFDFVHRNPLSYGRQVSLLPTKTTILGRQFIPPHNTPTIFDVAVDDGYPAISLWWPATFPARQSSPVGSLPGLGTPDIFGRLGVGIFYSQEPKSEPEIKTRTGTISKLKAGHYGGEIDGPQQMAISGMKQTKIYFELIIENEENGRLLVANKAYNLSPGSWSQIIEITFKVGLGTSIKAVTRAIFTNTTGYPTIYFLPLQLHPLKSPWPYGTPKRLMKDIWSNPGPYLTLGWPQDTTGLEEGFITDEQFLVLCDQICDHREKTLMRMLESYNEGILACIFDSLDRIQHMFLRDRMDIIEAWYVKLDSLMGRIQTKISAKHDSKEIQLLVMSDHGFGDFNYKVNLNRWLIDKGYLETNNTDKFGNLGNVNWQKTKAYAIGLNSIYLNLKDRESKGIVEPDKQNQQVQVLINDLLDWRGPNGEAVVSKARENADTFSGPYSKYGPDLVVGYNPGYRGSARTGMGEWVGEQIEENHDHWGADHCFDADSVPGVLFSNSSLENISHPSFMDIPQLAINKEIVQNQEILEPSFSDEDQAKVEDRLKELGYL